jgi:hypothetical protein
MEVAALKYCFALSNSASAVEWSGGDNLADYGYSNKVNKIT